MSFKEGMDFTDFEKTFFKLVQDAIPNAGKKGLFNAAAEMLRDADKDAPQTPFKHGDLRGSKMIETDAAGVRAPKDIEVTKVFTSGLLQAKAGYNSKYATRLHEAEPGQYKFVPRKGIKQPGSKWLSSKMNKNKEDYMKIVALTIKKAKV